MNRRQLAVLLGAVVVVGLSTPALAEGDPQRGYARAQMCAGCHGIADYRTAYPSVYSVPKLGGQQAAYLTKSLNDYKTGARKHPTMRGIAATLSDEEIADLAAYYSGASK